MKVFFVVKCNFPNGLATTARVINYCKGFLENNLKCEVIIPIALEKHEEPVKNTESHGVFQNIPFRYISNTPKRNKYLVIRKFKDLVDYTKTLIYLYRKLNSNDIVLVYEAGCIWSYLLAKIAHLKHSKVCMEINELPYGTDVETNKTIRMRNIMLSSIFPIYDAFITISQSLFDLTKKHAPKSYIIKIPILVDSNIADNVPKKEFKRPYIFHSGSLTEQKDGILGMLKGFAIANQQLGYKLDYILTGNLEKSRDAKFIKEIIAQYKLDDYVHFVGYLKDSELRIYQKNCLTMIINKEDTQQNKYCFSTKLGEYLSFAKPVILTNVGEAATYMNQSNSYLIDKNSPNQIAKSIIDIFNNTTKAKEIGLNGYELAKNTFSYKSQGKILTEFLIKSLNK